jgi:predicted GIY-YIG superfamily endonuclease/DNA-binding XRE family transcriptional regulator
MYIYRIHCKVNDRSYIGQSEAAERRKKEHMRALAKGRHQSKSMQFDYDLYGPEVFDFEILEEVGDLTTARKREALHINQFEAKTFGYNCNQASTRIRYREPKQPGDGNFREDGQETAFAVFMRERREHLRMTQRHIANKLGFKSAEAVGMIEAGKRQLDLDKVPALAATLECDALWLCRLAIREQCPALGEVLFAAEPASTTSGAGGGVAG